MSTLEELGSTVETNPFWFVRAGRGATFADYFLTEGVVAIGWNEVGELRDSDSDSEIESRFASEYPDEASAARRMWAGQVRRFTREISESDPVATYDSDQRLYRLGFILSDAAWREHPLARTRRVRWVAKVPRDRLSTGARNQLGAIMTLFRLSEEVSRELCAKALATDAEVKIVATSELEEDASVDETSESILRDEVNDKAEQFIEDQIARLSWENLQELVAGLLRAMGYRTRVADKGPDRGVDIFASPDGLGLQEPRIFVEVKHRPGTAMGSGEIRSFLGGRQGGDRCLYVSTGGYSREARYEAERASVPLMLLALPDLRELLVEHYDSLDTEARRLVPLTKIYWPAK